MLQTEGCLHSEAKESRSLVHAMHPCHTLECPSAQHAYMNSWVTFFFLWTRAPFSLWRQCTRCIQKLKKSYPIIIIVFWLTGIWPIVFWGVFQGGWLCSSWEADITDISSQRQGKGKDGKGGWFRVLILSRDYLIGIIINQHYCLSFCLCRWRT